ncbi:MAG: hypothetical protein PHV37_09050 [Candidatus Gastranaerophilales bacterium]|nr:hypothetical protein [Candidatus Gastranaerophilales bacterium]
MQLDKENLLCDGQAITADAATTNTIDLGKGTPGDKGFGTPKPFFAQVIEDFDNLTSMAFKLQTCATESGTYTDIYTSGDIALASLKAGYRFPINFLPKGCKRYLKGYFDITGTTAPTKGKVTAGFTAGDDASYQDL